jgi:hypothetical protein
MGQNEADELAGCHARPPNGVLDERTSVTGSTSELREVGDTERIVVPRIRDYSDVSIL